MTDRYIRNSDIKTFKWCRRNFMLSYMRQLEKTPDPFTPAGGKRDVGTLVHAGLQADYTGGDGLAVIEAERQMLLTTLTNLDPAYVMSKEWADVFVLASIMLEGYREWLEEEGVNAEEDTIGVEVPLQAYAGTFHGDNVFITGKMDRVVKNKNTGLIIIEDHKTVDNLAQGVGFAIDDQLLTYLWLWEAAGNGRAHEARHDMLRKVKRTARAKPPFYGRKSMVANEEQRENHLKHMGGTLSDIVAMIQAIERDPTAHQFVAYPNPGRDCDWKCDFTDVCAMLDQGDDTEGYLGEFYRPRNQDQEVHIT